jgi:uncharacterized membrane protein YbhN (UPF0104 family)
MVMKHRRAWIAVKILVSALFLFFALQQIGGLDQLSGALTNILWSWCLAGALAALLHIILSGFNIWLLLRAANTQLPIGSFLRIFIYSYCFSLILPGQSGDLTITLFLKRKGVPYTVSGACYVIDKLITFSFMLLVALYGFSQLLPPALFQWLLVAVAFGFIALLVCWRFISQVKLKQRYFITFQQAMVSFLEMLRLVAKQKMYLLLNIVVTVVNWGVVGLSYYFVFRALGQHISWPMVGVIPIMSSFVGYIPVSIAGLGTVEYSAVYLFSLIGASQAAVLGTYLVQRAIQYLLVAALLIIFLLLGITRPPLVADEMIQPRGAQ